MGSSSNLLTLIVEYFSIEEIRNICYELGLDYEEFPEAKSGMAREMLIQCEKTERLVRGGYRKRFFTAANLVNLLGEKQKQYQLDRFLNQLDHTDPLICDELGYVSFSRAGAEFLFQVFADRYKRHRS